MHTPRRPGKARHAQRHASQCLDGVMSPLSSTSCSPCSACSCVSMLGNSARTALKRMVVFRNKRSEYRQTTRCPPHDGNRLYFLFTHFRTIQYSVSYALFFSSHQLYLYCDGWACICQCCDPLAAILLFSLSPSLFFHLYSVPIRSLTHSLISHISRHNRPFPQQTDSVSYLSTLCMACCNAAHP